MYQGTTFNNKTIQLYQQYIYKLKRPTRPLTDANRKNKDDWIFIEKMITTEIHTLYIDVFL